MSPEEMQTKINQHHYEIEAVKAVAGKTLEAIDKLTEAVNKQTTQFAVYADKHDRVSDTMQDMQKQLQKHGENIAEMKPVTDAVRGLMWRVVFSSLAGGSAVAAIIVAVFAYINKAV